MACANARTPHRQSLEEAVPAVPAAAERCAPRMRAGRVGGPAESAFLLLVTCGLAPAAAIQRASRPAGADLPALDDMADSVGRAGHFMAGGACSGAAGAHGSASSGQPDQKLAALVSQGWSCSACTPSVSSSEYTVSCRGRSTEGQVKAGSRPSCALHRSSQHHVTTRGWPLKHACRCCFLHGLCWGVHHVRRVCKQCIAARMDRPYHQRIIHRFPLLNNVCMQGVLWSGKC